MFSWRGSQKEIILSTSFLYLHMSSSRIKFLVTEKGIETKNMFINNFHQIYTSPKKKSFYNFSGFKFKGN